MLRRPRTLALVAAATLTGWLLAASVASAQAPGAAGGGGGMFGFLGLPSIGDVVKKVVNKVFGALADALLPDFIKEAPGELVSWLATLPNLTADGTAVHSLMMSTRATGFAFLIVVLLYGAVRGMLPGEADHPMTVVGRVVGVAFFLVIFEWAFDQAIALFNTIAIGLLKNDVVRQGIGDTIERAFSPETIGANPLSAVLVLGALFLLIGLVAVKLMMLYLVPMFFVAGPLIAPLAVPRETAHIPRVMGQMFGAMCAIPAGWAILFGVAGALSSDMAAGRIDGGGMLTSSILAPMTTIVIFALAIWWPWAVLGMAKSLPGQLGIATSKGPIERTSGVAGSAMKLKLAAMFASGGLGAFAGAKAGASSGPRLAADQPTSTWRARSRPTETPGGGSSPGGSSRPGAGGPGEGSAATAGSGGAAPGGDAAGRRERGGEAPTPGGGSHAGAPGAAVAASGVAPAAPVAGDDPLRPGTTGAAGHGTPGGRSRQAATTPGRSVAGTPPAGQTATDSHRPSEGPSAASAPSGGSGAAAPTPAPSGTAGRPDAGSAPSVRDVPATPAPGVSPAVDPLRPHSQPADPAARAREAAQPHAADHIAGLPPRDLDSAREAFGKDPS
jgi:hypothetical protein